jgi:hypothetical protein
MGENLPNLVTLISCLSCHCHATAAAESFTVEMQRLFVQVRNVKRRNVEIQNVESPPGCYHLTYFEIT